MSSRTREREHASRLILPPFVMLDLTNRNKEKLARERLIGTDGHFESCGKCGYGGELLLCDKDGCKEAMHITCAGLVANPVENWYCSKCAV